MSIHTLHRHPNKKALTEIRWAGHPCAAIHVESVTEIALDNGMERRRESL